MDKQTQKKLIEQIMKADEELGLYSEQFYCKDESYHKIERCNKQCGDCLDFVNDLQ